MPPSPDAPARLVLSLPGGPTQEFTLSKATVTIGRATTSDIVLRDWAASRSHARVERTPGGYDVVDWGSLNGVRVNGRTVTRVTLAPGDVVAIGDSTFRFEDGRPPDDPELTVIGPVPELDQTVAMSPLSVHLGESGVPRVAVHTAARTWEVALSGDRLTVGRDPDNDIQLDFPAVSRRHAIVERRGDAAFLRDLGSRNGTWAGRDRIDRADLGNGSSVRIGPATLVFKQGHAAGDLAMSDAEVESDLPRRPVVVIPGFAGSNLWRGSEQIWPTLKMLGHSDLLQLDQRLEPRGIVDQVVVVPNLIRLDQYSVLTGYLRESLGYEQGKDLLEFAYDFRQDNRDSARRLAAAIDAWKISAPITIVAHSMGCLVARYYIERLGGRRRIERAILLGGPHAGTPYAFASLLRGPNLLPLGMMNLRLRDMLATYPSWYQILPTTLCVSDQRSTFELLSEESWVHESHRGLLRGAREFRRELGTRSRVPTVCIFGYGFRTVTGAVVERDASGALVKADVMSSDSGDGMIPETSGVLPGAEIHPVRQQHGALYVDNDVKMRLKLELTRPVTS